MRPVLPSVLRLSFALLLFSLPAPLRAQPEAPAASEVEQLKADLEDLQKQMAALSARIDALQAGSATTAEAASPAPPSPTAPVATALVPAGAAGATGPAGSLPVYGNVSAGSKIFNPDIAVIGDFLGAAGKSPGGASRLSSCTKPSSACRRWSTPTRAPTSS